MSTFRRLGIVGAGNVGSALVMALGEFSISSDEIVVAARDIKKAEAAILDFASAYPKLANKATSTLSLSGKFDVVIVTAGELPHGNITSDELLSTNLGIATEALKDVDFDKIVVIGTPVDLLTEELSRLNEFKNKQVIGFGGELDKARMLYSLLVHGLKPKEPLYVIGEHGPRAIPVYDGEQNYEEVRIETTTVLKRIVESGTARNLATGVQLARLLQALGGEERIMCVSAPNKEHSNLSITWPHLINGHGLVKKINIDNVGPKASSLLEGLIKARQVQ